MEYPESLKADCNNGNAADDTPMPARKFQDLRNAACGLAEIKEHLFALKILIGINQPEVPCATKEGVKLKEPTLISTLNELPDQIRSDHKDIHDLISQIENELT